MECGLFEFTNNEEGRLPDGKRDCGLHDRDSLRARAKSRPALTCCVLYTDKEEGSHCDLRGTFQIVCPTEA
eukprot:1159792-Pelagomonas_calceolata.AAC.2